MYGIDWKMILIWHS